MTDEQFLLFCHLTFDGFQIKEALREGQGKTLLFLDRLIGVSLLMVVIKSCQQMEMNENSLFCRLSPLVLGLPLTVVPASPPSPLHSIWGLSEVHPMLIVAVAWSWCRLSLATARLL